MKEFLTGSRAFFNDIKDFQPKDTDRTILIPFEEATFDGIRQKVKDGIDTFQIVYKSKQHLINLALERGGNILCLFLIPDVVQEIDLTISDLENLKPLRESLDKRHEYLGIIYDFYLKNGDFTLTEEQRQESYANYKAIRDAQKAKRESCKAEIAARRERMEKKFAEEEKNFDSLSPLRQEMFLRRKEMREKMAQRRVEMEKRFKRSSINNIEK